MESILRSKSNKSIGYSNFSPYGVTNVFSKDLNITSWVVHLGSTEHGTV